MLDNNNSFSRTRPRGLTQSKRRLFSLCGPMAFSTLSWLSHTEFLTSPETGYLHWQTTIVQNLSSGKASRFVHYSAYGGFCPQRLTSLITSALIPSLERKARGTYFGDYLRHFVRNSLYWIARVKD